MYIHVYISNVYTICLSPTHIDTFSMHIYPYTYIYIYIYIHIYIYTHCVHKCLSSTHTLALTHFLPSLSLAMGHQRKDGIGAGGLGSGEGGDEGNSGSKEEFVGEGGRDWSPMTIAPLAHGPIQHLSPARERGEEQGGGGRTCADQKTCGLLAPERQISHACNQSGVQIRRTVAYVCACVCVRVCKRENAERERKAVFRILSNCVCACVCVCV